MEIDKLLKEEYLSYINCLEHFESNFEQNVKEFFLSESRKCLHLETKDTQTGVWRLKDVLLRTEESLDSKYTGTENQLVLSWDVLTNMMGPLKLLPKFANLTIIEIPEEDLENESFGILKKIIYRLNIAPWRKVILVTYRTHLLNILLEGMKQGSFIKINEFENQVTSKIDNPEEGPLLKAAASGDTKAVVELLKAGSNIDVSCGYGENTALHLAAERGHMDMILTLLRSGANIVKNRDGNTPLHLAAWHGHQDIVMALLEHGANVDAVNNSGSTAVIQSARHGYYNTVVTLIEYGANINIQNDIGSSALHLATENGYYVVVYTLLNSGANVNSEDNNQYTPLHYAASYGYSDIVKALLSMEACIDPQTWEGKTPLDLAKKYSHKDIIQHLKDRLEERYVLRQAINIIKRRSTLSTV